VRSAVTAGTTPVSKPDPVIVARVIPARVDATEIEPAAVNESTVIERLIPAVKVSVVTDAAVPSLRNNDAPVAFGVTSATEPDNVSPARRYVLFPAASFKVKPNEVAVVIPALPDFAAEVKFTVAGAPAVVKDTVVWRSVTAGTVGEVNPAGADSSTQTSRVYVPATVGVMSIVGEYVPKPETVVVSRVDEAIAPDAITVLPTVPAVGPLKTRARTTDPAIAESTPAVKLSALEP
jgi:hypothetical protein